MNRKSIRPILATLALAIALLALANSHQAAAPPPPDRPPARKAVSTDLGGSGLVEPLNQTIAVGSPLPGVAIYVIPQRLTNTLIPRGTVLFKLDPRAQLGEIDTRKRDLEQARSALEQLREKPRQDELPPQEALVASCEENMKGKESEYQLVKRSFDRKSASLDELNKAKYALAVARAQYWKAQADLGLLRRGAWEADLSVQHAAVRQAQAKLAKAEMDLKRLTVTAPIDCKLLEVKVRVGEFVGAQPNLNLITLADVKAIMVRVDIDEFDVPRFHKGLRATGYLRGRPDRKYELAYYRTEPYIIPRKSQSADSSQRADRRVLQVLYTLKDKQAVGHEVHFGQPMEVSFDEPTAR